MNLNFILLLILVLLLLFIFFLLIWLLLEALHNKGVITRALNMSLFLITLPRGEKKEGTGKSEKEIISVMEQLYASLSSFREKGFKAFFYGQPYLTFEMAVPHLGEEISFYLAAPKRYEDVIEKTIHGFYPQASIERTEDYNIFNPEGVAAGAFLKLTKSFVFPFKTYQNLETDPLNEITNSLSKLEEKGEGAAVQILIRSAKPDWQNFGLKIAKEMREGKSFKEAYAAAGRGAFEKAISSVSAKPAAPETIKGSSSSPLQEELIKALESKAAKIGFETNIRLLASAANQARAEQILGHLESAFTQFTAPNLNSLKSVRVKGRRLRKLIYNFSFRIFNPKEINLLNTEELTSIYHFPSGTIETPKIKFVKAKYASPPVDLPEEGIIIGQNIYRGQKRVIRLRREDRRRHLYIIGQTGTGKSALLREMIKQDIEAGEGVAFLDPHGDTIEAILGIIPKERAEDVILCDATDLERPFGLNMLQYNPARPEQKTFIVNELINIFDKLYDLRQTGGPIFEQYTRNALLLLMDDPEEPVTLMDVPKVLSDKEYRDRLLAKCKSAVVKDFWEKEVMQVKGEHALAELVPYITSKFNVFIANDYMRPIISQVKSSFDFRQVLDQGKILLVNLSKGKLGDINMSLLGSIFVSKLAMAAFSRTDLPEEERKDFYLYMDEFQNFTTESISTILSEARKYRLNLIIAHQFIKQLPENIRSAVFGNVGSKICFRIGVEDAPVLVKEFEPVFDENDLINIDNFNAYVKLMIGGQTARPFNIQTNPPTKPNPEVAQAIKELSRLKYGQEI